MGALQHADASLQANRDFIKSAICDKRSWCYLHVSEVLRYASHDIRQDKVFIKGLMEQTNGAILKYADDTVRNNLAFIHELIDDAKSWQVVGSRTAGDKVWPVLRGAGDGVLNNKTFMLDCVKTGVWALSYAGDMLKNDESFVNEAMWYCR